MIAKTDRHQYFFETGLQRQEGRKGILNTRGVPDSITIATPHEFTGAESELWSPEQLFLGALCGSYMSTYLAFAEKKNLKITGFECNAIGQVNLVEGHLKFNLVNLFPKVFVGLEKDLSLARELLLKANDHCIVTRSMDASVIHHGEVMLKVV